MMAIDHAIISQALRPKARTQEQHIELQLLGQTVLIDGAQPEVAEMDEQRVFRITFTGISRGPIIITKVERRHAGEWFVDCLDYATRCAAEALIGTHLEHEDERIRDERDSSEYWDRIDGTVGA